MKGGDGKSSDLLKTLEDDILKRQCKEIFEESGSSGSKGILAEVRWDCHFLTAILAVPPDYLWNSLRQIL